MLTVTGRSPARPTHKLAPPNYSYWLNLPKEFCAQHGEIPNVPLAGISPQIPVAYVPFCAN